MERKQEWRGVVLSPDDILRLLDLVRSRPLGVILVVLGALVLFGALTKNRAAKGAGAQEP